MIFITDELGKFEKNIIELAENVGFKECKTIEAIDLFCGISERNDVLKEKDRYYAFIDIPQYWSVRADGLNGAIYDNKTKKANIYFKNPIEKRMVSRVEWIDRNNTVYKVDYYNKYGYMYCSENVSGGNVTVREFYDRNGDIKVLEQTGPKTYTTFGTRISPKSYRGFADYLEAYLKYNKIYDENIWLTSDEILNKFAWDYGNFKISYLPQNRLNSDLTVITQTNTAFRILCSEEQQVNWYKENSNYKCDRLYSYLENNKSKFGRKEAFIITESDQLEYIEQLINDFPEITFHIAASTIMSDKLTRLDINNNVELYPCITEQKRKELFERCDIYLDINHYRELYNAVNEAMVNNMIILAFDNTAHSKELYPMGNIFESSNYVKMKETLKNIITSQTIFNEYIDRQKKQLKQLAAKVVMGEVYNFMGLSCSYPDADDTKKQDDDEKRQFYSADIIYTTNGTLGFDFLFDNLVKKKEDRFLCDFHYVIIDEADSVLLDSAIMPLVISGVPRVQSNLYDVCDFFVTTLVEDIDYIEEDKAVWLTPKGVKFAESFFGISNFYGKENFEINRHVTLSLRAHKLLKNKKDYVVTDKKEVELFDGATGRLMHGVKLRGGQHQAIEAKEKVEISQEYRTVASVTFQNLFMMFDKMAGMSGTLMDAKDELFETYGKHVVRIPTNRPLKRVDRKDRYFKNGHDQFWTAVDDVIRLHETGQPVLVVLNSVTDTDLFSRLLIEKNIPHNVLNASNAFWEAQIIAGAGQLNAVTVATTMAGRGTDIKLGDGVKELGGLAVIGIGRMNNSRSERQARGRAGRQGDPGFSQYYVSLEDDIVGAEDDDKLQRYIDGKKRIGKRKIKRIVNQCQKLSVESEEMNRKKSLQYDQVLQRQRDLIYATRKKLLDGASVEQEKIVEIAKENISDFVNHFDCIQSNKKHGRRRGRKKYNDKNTNTEQYTSILNRYILDNISYKLDAGLTLSDMQSAATVSDYLMLRVYQGLSRQRERIGDEEAYEQFVREATLKAVDDGWVELIDYLEQLKYAVAGRASAQRNVMFEYQNEAFESFLDTEKAVKCNIIRNILLSDVKIGKDGRLHVIYP